MKKQPIIWMIILLYLLSLISYSTSTLADEESYSINFNSYIDLEYDLSPLNKPLEIDVICEIPITVEYWTNIPDIFKSLPSWFTYRFLFDTTINPMKKIKLEVNNTPSWANIYLSSPDMLVDIPYESDGRSSVETVLIITTFSDAPHIPYKIDLVASTEQMKRLNGFTYQESIVFTPEYNPLMEITNDYSTIHADRTNKTIIPIEVINKGNHKSQIIPSLIYDNSSYFDVMIEPISMNLNIEEQGIYNLSVNLNSEFGFFEDIDIFESIEIKFQCEKYPLDDNNNSIQESTFIIITYRQNDIDDFLNSYLTTLLIILFIICLTVILFIRRRRLRKK